ncbi:hypothetical protein [Micromonospora endolithica]|uniref:Uncharacterized protein n=1 Tax=Micromonospora endolithica TaxID=230091 RepID=A0A3A9ZA75_9ACTN|nr:hypothetical protein [Micromonospora endolithica]RKN45372.1 hypothetical protein D7223_17330 [Micromonospora endolithica]TWJ22922.1 hypothetical protein JD76_03045 [Micromonospora endolithica]
MVEDADADRLAASLAGRLDAVTFTDLTTDQVTARLIDAVADWAGEQGWRVYRRAPSVLPLPPPMSARQSVLDVACARPDGPPVVVEVDHGTRRRTWEKLLAEADAGRVTLWVRWGAGRFTAPPPPIRMVSCAVHRRPDPTGVLHSRRPRADRLPPVHSAVPQGSVDAVELPLPPTVSPGAEG